MNIYIPKFNPRTSLERILSLLWGETNDQVPHTRLEKAIYEIARGGKVLPSVSPTDTGKVLTASEDGAVWASGGGGGGNFIVTAVLSTSDAEVSCTIDKTFDEIEDAYESGLIPAIKITWDDEESEGFSVVGFAREHLEGNTITFTAMLTIDSDLFETMDISVGKSGGETTVNIYIHAWTMTPSEED